MNRTEVTYTGEWRSEGKIKEVTGRDDYWSITTNESACFGFEKSYGVVPVVGDTVSIRGLGSAIHGVKINDKIVFNHSDEEVLRRHKEWCDKRDREKMEAFERDRDKLDAQFNALPREFQKKIERHRKYNPKFRWELEPYELFVCSEAVKFSEYFKRYKTQERIAEEMKKFGNLDYKEQKNLLPTMDGDHTGNTFGKALLFASLYLKDPRYIPIMHGALAEIGGCDEYGCPVPTEEEWKEAGLSEDRFKV